MLAGRVRDSRDGEDAESVDAFVKTHTSKVISVRGSILTRLARLLRLSLLLHHNTSSW